ncbi:MAG: S9 family peptidase, partial [Bacteroidota bacterium]
MKRYLIQALCVLVIASSILPSGYTQNTLPPIIDREIFFGNPEIAGAQLSPDGKWMSFLKPYEEVRNIWVKKADEPFENAKVVTDSKDRPIPGYFWSRDSKYILYVQDKGGDENFHVYALDPFASPKEGAVVPDARNLTDVEGVRAIIYAVPRSKPNIMYVGLNDRDPAWHDLYKVNLTTGERELIRKNENQITNWIFDTKDEIRMASKTTEDGGTEILVLDGDTFKTCYTCSVLESCYIARFDKNGTDTYLVTNKGDLDLTQLMRFNPSTGKMELMEKDPKNEVDFGGAVFSNLTNEMVATTYVGDKTRIYFKDKNWEKEYEWLKKELPNVEVNLGSSTKDERKWLIYANSDTDPGATYLYDRDKKKLTFQYRPRPKLPVKDLAEMQPITYPSSDGLKIPAYLTTPKGVDAKNLPLVVFPHGGPWARDY